MNIVLATNYDDWEGLYINGVCVRQGHSLSGADVLDALKLQYEELGVSEYLADYGSLPVDLEELKGSV